MLEWWSKTIDDYGSLDSIWNHQLVHTSDNENVEQNIGGLTALTTKNWEMESNQQDWGDGVPKTLQKLMEKATQFHYSHEVFFQRVCSKALRILAGTTTKSKITVAFSALLAIGFIPPDFWGVDIFNRNTEIKMKIDS